MNDDYFRDQLSEILTGEHDIARAIQRLREFQKGVSASSLPGRRKEYYREASNAAIKERSRLVMQEATSGLLQTNFDTARPTVVSRSITKDESCPKMLPPKPVEHVDYEVPVYPVEGPRCVIDNTDNHQHLFFRDITNVTIIIRGCIESLRILNAQDCVIIAPAVLSSVSLEKIMRCDMTVCSRQLRIYDCQSSNFSLSILTPPICEKCFEMRISNFSLREDPEVIKMIQETGLQLDWDAGSTPAFVDISMNEAKSRYQLVEKDTLC